MFKFVFLFVQKNILFVQICFCVGLNLFFSSHSEDDYDDDQSWIAMADISMYLIRKPFQSFVVSMETEIHERIINDRRTMVVVDDDR